ncbi:MAG: hypothetical protein AAGD13_00750 [Pseudomonadota bacterium]
MQIDWRNVPSPLDCQKQVTDEKIAAAVTFAKRMRDEFVRDVASTKEPK